MKKGIKNIALASIGFTSFIALCIITNLYDQRTGLHTNDALRFAFTLSLASYCALYFAKKQQVS